MEKVINDESIDDNEEICADHEEGVDFMCRPYQLAGVGNFALVGVMSREFVLKLITWQQIETIL